MSRSKLLSVYLKRLMDFLGKVMRILSYDYKFPHYIVRKVRVCTEIIKHPNNFNRDISVPLSPVWSIVVI